MNTQADLQRWSDEVARDPRSIAFVPLARAYRKQGLTDAALQLCMRGLEHHPANLEAHGLLALLYLERGDRERAADEWSIVLRMEPDNFEALRGMGFCYLERDQMSRARQMLERAALLRPGDPTVREALGLLGARSELGDARSDSALRNDPLLRDDPWASPGPEPERDAGPDMLELEVADEVEAEAAAFGGAVAQGEPVTRAAGPAGHGGDVSTGRAAATFEFADGPAGAGAATAVAVEPRGGSASQRGPAPALRSLPDPTKLFDELLESGTLLGALLVDAHGLVHAGRLTDEATADAAVLGAVLGGSVEEAARTVHHLSLGEWRGILLEADQALLQLAPVGKDAVVILAARRNVPTGWLMRTGAQAAEHAARYLEAYA
ncbi:hypothetical protein BH23GEM9_BH23GEM9_28160 [soil metagenome]